MRFGQLVQAYKPDSDLYVSQHHEKWLKQNPNAQYSREAIEFAVQVLRTPQRDRTKAWSASSIGGCPRAAQFQWLGLPQKPITDSKTINIFHNGSHMHLRWQLAGITAGWLTEAEVFRHNEEYQLKGSLDGICADGRGVEFKSINSFGFKQVLDYGPKKEHLFQIAAYFLMCPDIDKFSLVYEDKNTQDWTEIVVPRNKRRTDIQRTINDLNAAMKTHEYIEMRDDCWAEEGWMYRSCPYAPICRDQGDSW